MSYYIPEQTRMLVLERAGFRCEYCRIPDSYSNFRFHFEHIIALQHGGATVPSSLAYACSNCNWKKGPNLSTVLEPNGPLVRLFHPRKDNWFEHFSVEHGIISPISEIGAATIKLLGLNTLEYIIERKEMMELGIYP